MNKRSSFTLIEVLLALTLAALVTALAGRILISSAQTTTMVECEVLKLEQTAIVFDQLRSDLGELLTEPLSDEAAIELFGFEHPALQLRVLTAAATDPGALHLPRLPCLVRYRVEAARPGLQLIRERRSGTQPGEAWAGETLARGLEEVGFQVLVGTQWKSRYAGNEAKTDKPIRAVRLTCRWASESKPQQRTFVLPRTQLTERPHRR